MTILQLGHGSQILSFTDSSRALDWMNKVSFEPVSAESHDAVACWIGWILVSNETSLYSQHIKVKENIITDPLSQDFHMSDQTLTNKFNLILPPQTVVSFHMKQLPRNIICWISSRAAASKQPTASPKPLQSSILATRIGGAHS